ncbi:MAG: two-component sensor histidine kinase [Rubrivivax sp.]|nr:two-component sensor histidine kinase [Rubrivivax sp.]
MGSIERTLLRWTLGTLALGALLVSLITYFVTLEEMHEVFDADLQHVAKAVASYHRAGHHPGQADDVQLPIRTGVADEYEIVTMTWTPQGRRIFSSDPRVALPFSSTEGLSHPVVEGQAWVVYSNVSAAGVAQAAQRLAAREEMAGESAGKVFPPLIGLTVVIGGVLVFGLRRGFRPLGGAAQDVARRSAHSLAPISLEKVPKEIAPLVSSINDLMSRLAVSFAAQRRFLADAAHELRTPVTALRLQVQLLQESKNESERARALSELDSGVARSQRLIEQLLHIARTEPDGETLRIEPVDLADLVRSVVGTFSIKAEQRRIDLGATTPPNDGSVVVAGDCEQITVLLNNLVENALRYTPAGGVVDVEAGVRSGVPELRVADTGPGIPQAEQARVFDRFYRGADATALAHDGSGSGLGLAIVRAIAERHGAQVSLQMPVGGQGLVVLVRFAEGAQCPGQDLPAANQVSTKALAK